MELIIQTPMGVALDEEVDKVSLPASPSPFTVLKNHAPIIAMLKRGEIVYEAGGELRKATIDGGVARVKNNVIIVTTERIQNKSDHA